MKYIKPMTLEEFTGHLLVMKVDQTVEFATETVHKWPEEIPDPCDCQFWFYARKFHINEYDSLFIVIDYCGGEEARAIPLSMFYDHSDNSNRILIRETLEQFFDTYDCDVVFVEMEEE